MPLMESIPMSDPDAGPQLHIDSDWKAQAQAEKAKLAQRDKDRQEQAQPAPGAAKPPPPGQRFPDADFAGLMNMLVSQALMSLGAMAHPQTGQPHVDLDLARHMIDLLSVLEEKTKGNLADDEAKHLATALYELRSSYVQIANASRSPATGGQGM